MIDYLKKFEAEVVLKGYREKIFGSLCEFAIPLREGKLSKTAFGKFIGNEFEFDGILSINYYGHFKLSTGILEELEKVQKLFVDVRSIKSKVIYFNSIKFESIKSLKSVSSDLKSELIKGFESFKNELIYLRWKLSK